jgi:hypothetical protein
VGPLAETAPQWVPQSLVQHLLAAQARLAHILACRSYHSLELEHQGKQLQEAELHLPKSEPVALAEEQTLLAAEEEAAVALLNTMATLRSEHRQ